MADPKPVATGHCLCGKIRYTVSGRLRSVLICHCSQCRRWHGHVGAYTAAAENDLTIEGDDALAWFRSSDKARRGFCRNCGSSLFWKPDGKPYIAIAAGTLDAPTGLITSEHLFTESAGDYYAIVDGVQQLPAGFA
ncbi:MAG: GFA family protein [Proteobacteria bacterium]|nr:GFA family protein [Pseudomonadota bacterium]MBI3498885.1 GFA family protein [Pseudomonadota bacterium]